MEPFLAIRQPDQIYNIASASPQSGGSGKLAALKTGLEADDYILRALWRTRQACLWHLHARATPTGELQSSARLTLLRCGEIGFGLYWMYTMYIPHYGCGRIRLPRKLDKVRKRGGLDLDLALELV